MSTALQTSMLPRSVDPRRLANQGVALNGEIAPDQCSRLADAVLEIIGPVTAALHFSVSEQGQRMVTGSAAVTVSINCHRCLEPMNVDLQAEVEVAIVWSDDDARNVPRELDPWVVETESADIIALVEEELLLALPIVNYHSEKDCTGAVGYSTGDESEPEQSTRSNPFEVLGQLKQ